MNGTEPEIDHTLWSTLSDQPALRSKNKQDQITWKLNQCLIILQHTTTHGKEEEMSREQEGDKQSEYCKMEIQKQVAGELRLQKPGEKREQLNGTQRKEEENIC